MAYINEKRAQIQAFKKHLSKTDSHQWGLAFNANPQREGYINGADLRAAFPRKSSSELGCYGDNRGATKHGYKEGELFILRYMLDGARFRHNQFIAQIKLYQRVKETPDADYFAPIFRFGMARGDKNAEYSPRMLEELYIVTQCAEKKGDVAFCVRKAHEMNIDGGFDEVQTEEARYNHLVRICQKYGLHDVVDHPDNCGVIFDYSKNCYKAVILDYGL